MWHFSLSLSTKAHPLKKSFSFCWWCWLWYFHLFYLISRTWMCNHAKCLSYSMNFSRERKRKRASGGNCQIGLSFNFKKGLIFSIFFYFSSPKHFVLFIDRLCMEKRETYEEGFIIGEQNFWIYISISCSNHVKRLNIVKEGSIDNFFPFPFDSLCMNGWEIFYIRLLNSMNIILKSMEIISFIFFLLFCFFGWGRKFSTMLDTSTICQII